jgi:hypothetical protein
MTIRIHQLATELGVKSTEILEKCKKEGLDVKNHMSMLSTGMEATIREWFSEYDNMVATGKRKKDTIIECVMCKQKLRITIDAKGLNKCPKCKTTYHCQIDKYNNVIVFYKTIIRSDKRTAREILGVSENATFEQIKSAFRSRIKEYHPDKVAHLGSKLKHLAENETKLIIKSFYQIKK